MLISCDTCNESFRLDETMIKNKKVVGDTKEHYFKCPHCNEKYTSFYTNNESRAYQLEMNKIKKQLVESPDDDELKHTLKQLESKHKLIVLGLTEKMKGDRNGN